MIDPGSQARTASRLAEFGLREDLFREAVRIGLGEASRTTLNDPVTAYGYTMWHWTVRHIREELTRDSAWERRDRRGFPTVARKGSAFAVGVSSGDSGVGREDQTPHTRNPKGSEVAALVSRNQLRLFDAVDESKIDEATRTTLGLLLEQTWLLLYYIDQEAQEIRLELSLPIRMEESGPITSWQERIILAPVSTKPADEAPVPHEDYEAPVRRRTG